MLLAAVYACLRFTIAVLISRGDAEDDREIEVLALRHQLAVLRRQVKRPELTPAID